MSLISQLALSQILFFRCRWGSYYILQLPVHPASSLVKRVLLYSQGSRQPHNGIIQVTVTGWATHMFPGWAIAIKKPLQIVSCFEKLRAKLTIPIHGVGGRDSTEVAFELLNKQPAVQILAPLNIFSHEFSGVIPWLKKVLVRWLALLEPPENFTQNTMLVIKK